MNLTDRMAAWVDATADQLRAVGEVTFSKSHPNRPKPSAHLVVSGPTNLIEVIVWDSGEVELSHGALGDLQDEHHEIDDPADLDALLDGLVTGLR